MKTLVYGAGASWNRIFCLEPEPTQAFFMSVRSYECVKFTGSKVQLQNMKFKLSSNKSGFLASWCRSSGYTVQCRLPWKIECILKRVHETIFIL